MKLRVSRLEEKVIEVSDSDEKKINVLMRKKMEDNKGGTLRNERKRVKR